MSASAIVFSGERSNPTPEAPGPTKRTGRANLTQMLICFIKHVKNSWFNGLPADKTSAENCQFVCIDEEEHEFAGESAEAGTHLDTERLQMIADGSVEQFDFRRPRQGLCHRRLGRRPLIHQRRRTTDPPKGA